MSSSSTRYRAHALAPCVLLACLACEPQPGDYWVYRVAFETAKIEGPCWYPDMGPPPDVASDKDSYFYSSTLAMYQGPNDLQMDVPMPPKPSCAAPSVQAASALTLIENDDADEGDFYFQAITVDVQFLGVDQYEAVQTDTTTTALVLDTHGSAVDGVLRSTTVTLCDFITATPSGDVCPSPPLTDRIVTWPYSGVELDDVTVTKSVDPPPPPPPPPQP